MKKKNSKKRAAAEAALDVIEKDLPVNKHKCKRDRTKSKDTTRKDSSRTLSSQSNASLKKAQSGDVGQVVKETAKYNEDTEVRDRLLHCL